MWTSNRPPERGRRRARPFGCGRHHDDITSVFEPIEQLEEQRQHTLLSSPFVSSRFVPMLSISSMKIGDGPPSCIRKDGLEALFRFSIGATEEVGAQGGGTSPTSRAVALASIVFPR